LRYYVPSAGEPIETEHGQAQISRIIAYHEVIDELKAAAVSEEDIRQFESRVGHFLEDVSRYFECEIVYSNGETERIDWSEYSCLRAKRKRRGC
jgi:hypothetical protein